MNAPGSSPRYERQGKAAAYQARNPTRNRREQALLSTLLAKGGHPSSAPPRSILDAPCGTGRLYPLLRQLFPSASYTGLDGSLAMLERARPHPPTPLLLGDLFHLPLERASFDLVISFRFLHHLPPAEAIQALRQLARISRSDLVLSAFHPWSAHNLSRRVQSWLGRKPLPRFALSPRKVSEMLDGEGFREVKRVRMGLLRDLWVGLYRRQSGPGGG